VSFQTNTTTVPTNDQASLFYTLSSGDAWTLKTNFSVTTAVSTPQVTRERSKTNVIAEKKLTNVVAYSLSSVQRMITDPKLYAPEST
jgi:hypothetical protein